MTHLIPEKRLDRNGKLVTKHVRVTPQQGTGRSTMPSPSLSPKTDKQTVSKRFKPRKIQLEQRQHAHTARKYQLDSRFISDKERYEWIQASSVYYSFKANEVEVYDVLSVAPTGHALRMLHAGVRTAEDARAYLINHAAPELITDRSEVVAEALAKNINHYEFVEHYDNFAETGAEPERIVDAIRFSSTSLRYGSNRDALKEIIEGNITFNEIKAIGVTRLKPNDHLSSLIVTMRRMHRGEGDYTVDGLKTLLDRASSENLQSIQFRHLCKAMDHVGMEETLKFQHLSNLANSYRDYKISLGREKFGDSAEDRAVYAARFKEGVNDPTNNGYVTNDYYDAGIPLELAIDVHLRGFSAREAQAIHHEGIESSVSGGWL